MDTKEVATPTGQTTELTEDQKRGQEIYMNEYFKAIKKSQAEIDFANFVGSRKMDRMVRKNKIRRARQK